MISSKIWAGTALCWLLALPCLLSQETKTPAATPAVSKWEFGLRGGAGFTSYTLNGYYISPQSGNGQVIIDRPGRYKYLGKEFFVGGFATYNFNQRWSLRSELSLVNTPFNSLGVAIGLFPRYRLTKWWSLEAGLETKKIVIGNEVDNTKLWLGTAFNWKGVELNFRFAPSYHSPSQFSSGGWNNTYQVGMSFNLCKGSHSKKEKAD